jgi:hypothetical protein
MIFYTDSRTSMRSNAWLLPVLPIVQLVLCYCGLQRLIATTMAFPMQIVVSQYTTECLYEQLEHE